MLQIRSPSVMNGPALFKQAMFPPAEYNPKSMRNTVKQLQQSSPPQITTIHQTLFPPATPTNNEDYSTVQPKSLLTNRGIRYYNKVVEDF